MQRLNLRHIVLHLTFSSDFVPLVNVFGVYFQIRDDYMNLQSTEVCGAAFGQMGHLTSATVSSTLR